MAINTISTANKDVDYIQKDFNSSSDAMISFAGVNFGPGTSANRLWTDFNIDSFSRNWLEIVAFTADVLFFYLDTQATQAYLQTATIRSAVNDIAKQFGFVPATETSAFGFATFTVSGAVTIPRGFRVRATNGAEFFLTSSIVAGAAGDFTGSVLQGQLVNETFVAEGIQAEEIDLAGPNVIRDLDNTNPQDVTPQVTVNGNSYTLVDSFIRHDGTDTDAITDSLGNVIGGGGRVFLLDLRPDGTNYIRFGDGVFGRKVESGENIIVSYRSGGGTEGNIPAETLVQLIDSNALVSSVINSAEFSGGADEQSIDKLRSLIPASLRTLERAVAEQDYSDILEVNFSEVFAASTEPNKTDPGIDINIYVVPQGIGIPNISDNTVLRTRLSNFIDRRKTVTVQFSIEDAFGVDVLISLEVFVTETASRTSVSQAIIAALQEFFDLTTGGRDGSGITFASPILIKDICDLIENIQGIDRFEIKQLSYRPRIDKRLIGLLTEYNTTDVTIYRNVEELEWLAGAAGAVTEPSGAVLLDNTGLIGFTYTSGTGLLQYSFPVDLEGVSPGDLFRDSSAVDYTIFAVDTVNNNVVLDTGLGVDDSAPATSDDGSIRNGSTTFESYKVYRKIRAVTTNLSIDSITDNNLDLSVLTGTGSAIAPRVLLDNTNVYKPGEFATGNFYLVDAAGNIWEIQENDSNTLTTSVTAVNDASIVNITTGDYSIVEKLVGYQLVFNDNIFNVQFNNKNTIYSIAAQFSQIGTIGDEFQISKEQSNVGVLGVALDLISYNAGTGQIRLNGSPNLAGINTDYSVIDSTGQVMNVVAVDNISKPFSIYENTNVDTDFLLEGTGLGQQVSQGFKVPTTDIYAVVSLNLRREGNIVGNMVATIVADAAGLPDLGAPVATANPIAVTDIAKTSGTVTFNFTVPPTLTSGVQYHLVLSGDAAYNSAESSGSKSFDNTGLETFTYTTGTGIIAYDGVVNLSSVLPGNFFQDGAGALFEILAVDDAADEITIATGQTVDLTVATSDDGAVIINDRIIVGVDTSSPSYVDGEFSRYDGASWSNSTLGPSPSGTPQDAAFSVEGTRSITVDTDLTPATGPGATASVRYYDDENQISFIAGISVGQITSSSDVDALGRGTLASVSNRPLDRLTFRTSRYADDVVNLRKNEIPRIKESDIKIQIFGGVE